MQGSLLYQAAKDGHWQCAKVLLAFDASTAYKYEVTWLHGAFALAVGTMHATHASLITWFALGYRGGCREVCP